MPVWLEHIHLGDVFHNDELTFEQWRDTIVERLRASKWLRTNDDVELALLVEELGSAESNFDFNVVWDALYDKADNDRIWIATRD